MIVAIRRQAVRVFARRSRTFARENPRWGYDRIQGALANVGYHITDTTIGNILKAHGIEPAPDRKQTTTWKTFLKAHWDVIAATDFLTVEVWTKGGLVTFYVLFVIELATRRVEVAGITTSPDESWMRTMACNLTNCEDGFLNGQRYLIHDRGTKFCTRFLRHRVSQTATAFAQPERLRRTVCAFAEARLPRPHDLLRRAIPSQRSQRIHRTLSPRA